MKNLRNLIIAIVALVGIAVMPSAFAFGQLTNAAGLSSAAGGGGQSTPPPSTTAASSVAIVRAVLSHLFI